MLLDIDDDDDPKVNKFVSRKLSCYHRHPYNNFTMIRSIEISTFKTPQKTIYILYEDSEVVVSPFSRNNESML